MRLDKLLVEKKYFSSREKAQLTISQKLVKVNGEIVDKSSKDIDETATIEIIDIFNKYVSRGGLKLEKAITDFSLDFKGKRVLDIGASTGGFTDCALHAGADFVFAVDVGTEQLSPTLQNHPRVKFLENKDFRELSLEETGGKPFDFIVSDVSFISLTYIIPYLAPFLAEDGKLMLLIKPQFEAGASFLSKSGIVKDDKGLKISIQKVELEAINNGYFLNKLSISTLLKKIKM
jgi:23S rRNA (cytidine1920-2'-O)/16S rRNA (cytidine1409-2'-O)-methyltransferase